MKLTTLVLCAVFVGLALLSAQARPRDISGGRGDQSMQQPADDLLLRWMNQIAQQELQAREKVIAGIHTLAEAEGQMEIHRRDLLKMAGSAALASVAPALPRPQTNHSKKVIVVGGSIAGLCCGYELAKRGHEAVILEAAGRPGGHVRTIH